MAETTYVRLTDDVAITALDLGCGVYFEPDTGWTDPPRWIGGTVWHVHPSGRPCAGYVPFEPHPECDGPLWSVTTLDPLTITPSVMFGGVCGLHGFIANGAWVPA